MEHPVTEINSLGDHSDNNPASKIYIHTADLDLDLDFFQRTPFICMAVHVCILNVTYVRPHCVLATALK